MLQSSPKTAPLIICISFMLFPLIITAHEPADSLLIKDTATSKIFSDSSQISNKKKKKPIRDTTNNQSAMKVPAYTPYNNAPAKAPVTPSKDLPVGAEILRTIFIDRKKINRISYD
ncbi:MAG TPA: hypothetical protein PLZ10_09630 [Chitinophagaceae bacterium]|nr:hypothetical protein [Chitinophagaceae bacterium]